MINLLALYALIGGTVPWSPIFKGYNDGTLAPMPDEIMAAGSENGPDCAALIETPKEAYNIRIAMLRSAQVSIDVVYYAIHFDNSGEAFLGELLSAADRGVAIRILVDGKMNAFGTSRSIKCYRERWIP